LANKLVGIAWATLRKKQVSSAAMRPPRHQISARSRACSLRDLQEGSSKWPDSRSAFGKPGERTGTQCRGHYEAPGAQMSILAAGLPMRPSTLTQTDQNTVNLTCRRGWQAFVHVVYETIQPLRSSHRIGDPGREVRGGRRPSYQNRSRVIFFSNLSDKSPISTSRCPSFERSFTVSRSSHRHTTCSSLT
jgi:hypothetical protein